MSNLTYWSGVVVLSAETEVAMIASGREKEVEAGFIGLARSKSELEQFSQESATQQGFRILKFENVEPLEDKRATTEQVNLTRRVTTAKPIAFGTFRKSHSTRLSFFDAPDENKLTYRQTGWDQVLMPKRGQLWALIDGVNWPEFCTLVQDTDTEHCCLYSSADPSVQMLAPWLVRVNPASMIANVLQSRDQSTHSFVLFCSAESLWDLRKHFRRYTMMQLPEKQDEPVYFRFYDPRVMLDSIIALPKSVKIKFLSPLLSLIIPMSEECFLPEDIENKYSSYAFSDSKNYNGNLVEFILKDYNSTNHRALKGSIDKNSVEKFALLQRRRSVARIAKELYDDFGTKFNKDEILKAAEMSPESASLFGMYSKKQVGTMAYAILKYGPKFWERSHEAAKLLRQPGKQPWQRKDDLIVWLNSSPKVDPLVSGGSR